MGYTSNNKELTDAMNLLNVFSSENCADGSDGPGVEMQVCPEAPYGTKAVCLTESVQGTFNPPDQGR